MARFEFKLPDIGEGVTEGEITGWLIKPGDVIKEDEPMVEVMTDKATVTITSPRAGKIAETRGKVGDVVPVHAVLVVFELDAGGAETAQKPERNEKSESSQTQTNGHTNGHAKDDGPAATAVGDIKESLPGMGASLSSASSSESSGGAGVLQGYFNAKPLATPATRKLARDMSVDLRNVPPTGPQGRVTKVDVESFVKGPSARSGSSQPQAHAPSSISAYAPVKITPPQTHGAAHVPEPLEERVPFAGMRRKIAAKMAQSVHTAAHFTFVEECDVSELKAVRARMKPEAERQGVKLSFLPFIVRAVTASLKRHPILNSALDETTNELVYRKYYNIGIAVSTDAGLIVPVVKDADKRSFLSIGREIDRLAADARTSKLKLDDLSGSTFTITSLGSQGGLFATPIINFPEVAILGVHQMKDKPVVKNGQIVIGSVMLLSLSFDHRIVDGHIGAAFAYDVISYLENPDRLFLDG